MAKPRNPPVIRITHWIVYNSMVTPHTCECMNCKQSWNSLEEVSGDCPARRKPTTVTYEAWKRSDGSEVAFSTREKILEEQEKGLIDDQWVFLHRFDADSWTEAMTRHHQMMGYKPYKPMPSAE